MKSFKKYLFIAVFASVIGYILLGFSKRTGLVDSSIEAILFLGASFIALKGLINKASSNKNFKKFEFFYSLTYFMAAASLILTAYYYMNNPQLAEIGVEHILSSKVLIIHSVLKSLSLITLIFAWSSFYKYLNIKLAFSKKIVLYLSGLVTYIALSVLVSVLVKDTSVISMGVLVGLAVGVFALIAVDKRTRFLTIIFSLFSLVHLIEFYMVGKNMTLSTGINNPIYWSLIILYFLEVNRWIKHEENSKS